MVESRTGDHSRPGAGRIQQGPDARAAYAWQADEDWRSFLTHRAREMRAGARLVILTMARDDSGDFGYRPLLGAMYASLLDLIDQGLIRTEEVRRMAIPTVGRTRAEFLSPLGQDGRFAGLSIEHLEVFNGEDRIWEDLNALKTPARSGRNGLPSRGLPCFRGSLRKWTGDAAIRGARSSSSAWRPGRRSGWR
jgi:hypothetical protein